MKEIYCPLFYLFLLVWGSQEKSTKTYVHSHFTYISASLIFKLSNHIVIYHLHHSNERATSLYVIIIKKSTQKCTIQNLFYEMLTLYLHLHHHHEQDVHHVCIYNKKCNLYIHPFALGGNNNISDLYIKQNHNDHEMKRCTWWFL